MIKILTVDEMRKAEAAADAAGYTYAMMMEAAGKAVAERALQLIADRPQPKVTLLIGGGHNGGDGLVAGRTIAQQRTDAQVRFYLLKQRDDDNFKKIQDAGLFVAYLQDDHDKRVLKNMVASADVVIDALFGIGVRLPIKDDAQTILRFTNQALNERTNARRDHVTLDPTAPLQVERPPKQYVLAVDCPSGLDCDTGELDKNAIPADETVTFIAAKPGLFEFPGAAAVGKLHIAKLELPEKNELLDNSNYAVLDNENIRQLLPARPADSHKGTFGKALIVAGSVNYTGAAALSAKGAYRSGAGLVSVAAAAPIAQLLAANFLEATWLLLPHDMGVISDKAAPVLLEATGNYDSMLIGPGLGREQTTCDFLQLLLTPQQPQPKRQIGFTAEKPEKKDSAYHLPPLVIDADALNILSAMGDWWTLVPSETILTPHPGEMKRLSQSAEIGEVQSQRPALAGEKAAEWDVVLVLKGAHTIIAAPDGRLAVSPFKTDALATAGTGDVLAGLIAGFVAQGLTPFDAAQVGVYVHGLAGVLAARRSGSGRSVMAEDVAAAVGAAFATIEEG